jgi:hypothetical protein
VQVELDMFGIAKNSVARKQVNKLKSRTDVLLVLWVLDTPEDYYEACLDGAGLVITNRPLELQGKLRGHAGLVRYNATNGQEQWLMGNHLPSVSR